MLHDTIGVIGTTALAAEIAARLAGATKGPRVIVYGLDAATTQGMGQRARIERAPNLFDLASECEVVIAAYDSHEALRAALAGDADRPGLLGAFQPGSVLCDFSPGLPDQCRRLAGQLAGGAIGLVEMGIAGDVVSGDARLFAGGFGEHIERLAPVLARLGTLKRAGPQGSGRTLAALTECVRAAYHAAMAEAQAIAAANGIVPDDLAEPPLSPQERAAFSAQVAFANSIAGHLGVATPIFTAAGLILSDGT